MILHIDRIDSDQSHIRLSGCGHVSCTFCRAPAQGALAIRRIFSQVDMITNTKFSNFRMFLKLVWFGSKVCIVSIKICFKVIHQAVKCCAFPILPPLILRLSTGYHLDPTLSNCIASFQKVKLLKC